MGLTLGAGTVARTHTVTDYLGLFQKLSSGWVGGPQALFCPVGGGCLVDNVFGGWAVTCPGGQGVFDPYSGAD